MPKCPSCSHPEAYLGLNVVECPRPTCRHYVAPEAAKAAEGLVTGMEDWWAGFMPPFLRAGQKLP